MSHISEFAANLNAYNDKMESVLTEIQEDIKNLNDQITGLHNDDLDQSDKDLLSALSLRCKTILEKVDSINSLTPAKPVTEEPQPGQPAQPEQPQEPVAEPQPGNQDPSA